MIPWVYPGPDEGGVFCQKLALWFLTSLTVSTPRLPCWIEGQKVFSVLCWSHLYGGLTDDGNKIFTIWSKKPWEQRGAVSRGGLSRKQLLPSCGRGGGHWALRLPGAHLGRVCPPLQAQAFFPEP